MTDEQKYLEVLKALGEIIAKQQSDLYFKDIQIDNLQKQLEKAEAEAAGVQSKCETK